MTEFSETEIKKTYAKIRLKEIEEEITRSRPLPGMDSRWDIGGYWERLYKEQAEILKLLGKDKPHKYKTAQEKFEEVGKSPTMIAQENAAMAIMKEKND